LCAEKYLVHDEDAQAFAALEASILEELAPRGALQQILAGRIVRAAWRLERAERIEAELFAFRMDGEENLALALIRDGNGTRSFDTLMRYRGSALAEFFRALRTLQALQDQARAIVVPAAVIEASPPAQPNKPKIRGNPGDSGRSRTIEATRTAAPRRQGGPGAAAPLRDRRAQPSRSTP
jgi:hypothetical protein